jgi:predicted AlkP superfamily pyrophosphatase or phosphodiesterase
MLLGTTTMIGMARASMGTVRAAAALTVLLASAAWQAAPRRDPPRLVVLIVVDQFRGDYVEWYGHQWTKGLRRLLDRGAVFPDAAYSFALTKTCAGHATIATGAFPSTHGMVDNAWYDRETRRSMPCTTDPAAVSVPFGGAKGSERHGPHQLAIPTFADELRRHARRPPRIVSVSLKARSAITLAGQASPQTMAIWEEDDGTWATSTAYATAPWPDVDAYVRAHPIDTAHGQAWTRLLPDAAYRYDDNAPGEPADGTFPHLLTGRIGATEHAEFVSRWERSPWSDLYIGELAMALTEELRLGRQSGTDLLALGFTSLDTVGHAFGPRSHEVQDVLVRLDALLGRMFALLDKRVGQDRYVVALSGDHGVALIPEQATALGLDAGRVSTTAIRQAVEGALTKILGAGTYVANITPPYVYFAPGVLDRIRAQPEAARAVERAIRSVPGIQQVHWADAIASAGSTDDVTLQAFRRSYFAGRSGDLAFVVKPNWIPQAAGTTHGTVHAYDTRVPLLLMGAGIRAGTYRIAASPADIAPTLASLVGVTLPKADGRVLVEALVKLP